MRIKIFHTTCSTLLSILVLGCVMQKYTEVNAEERKNPSVIIPQPNSDFRQLTNTELWERRLSLLMREGINRSHQEMHDIKQKFVASNQGFYDYYLKMFLCSVYPEKYNFDDVDMNELKHFQWVIATNKSSYNIGEPVGIRLTLKNISDTEVKANYNALYSGFMLNSIRLEQLHGKEKLRDKTFLTTHGYR